MIDFFNVGEDIFRYKKIGHQMIDWGLRNVEYFFMTPKIHSDPEW